MRQLTLPHGFLQPQSSQKLMFIGIKIDHIIGFNAFYYLSEYIQTSGSLPVPWESNPSVFLTEPPGIPAGSLIIL